MASEPRKISAKAFVADVRAGLGNPDLMQKYSLSEKQLNAAFMKLMEKGAIDKTQLESRTEKCIAAPAIGDDSLSGVETGPTPPEELADAGKESGERRLVRKAAGLFVVVDSYINDKLRILRNTDQPILRYVWRAWLIAFIPSIVVSTLATAVFAMLGYEDRLPDMSPMFFLIVGVIIAPWVETVFMGCILGVLKLIIKNTLWVCLVSAVIWGVLHGLQSIGQGLAVTWVFFVLSLSFMEWWKKSKTKAICAAALIHTCQNSVAFIALLIFALAGAESTQVKKIQPSPPAQTKQVSPSSETQKLQSKGAISAPTPAHPMDNKPALEMNKQ